MAALQGQNLNFQNIYEVFPHKRLGGGLGIYAPLPIPPPPHRRFAGPCRKRRDHHGARGRQTPACSITSALVIRWFVT